MLPQRENLAKVKLAVQWRLQEDVVPASGHRGLGRYEKPIACLLAWKLIATLAYPMVKQYAWMTLCLAYGLHMRCSGS